MRELALDRRQRLQMLSLLADDVLGMVMDFVVHDTSEKTAHFGVPALMGFGDPFVSRMTHPAVMEMVATQCCAMNCTTFCDWAHNARLQDKFNHLQQLYTFLAIHDALDPFKSHIVAALSPVDIPTASKFVQGSEEYLVLVRLVLHEKEEFDCVMADVNQWFNKMGFLLENKMWLTAEHELRGPAPREVPIGISRWLYGAPLSLVRRVVELYTGCPQELLSTVLRNGDDSTLDLYLQLHAYGNGTHGIFDEICTRWDEYDWRYMPQRLVRVVRAMESGQRELEDMAATVLVKLGKDNAFAREIIANKDFCDPLRVAIALSEQQHVAMAMAYVAETIPSELPNVCKLLYVYNEDDLRLLVSTISSDRRLADVAHGSDAVPLAIIRGWISAAPPPETILRDVIALGGPDIDLDEIHAWIARRQWAPLGETMQ